MQSASPFAFLGRAKAPQVISAMQGAMSMSSDEEENDLNVFVVTFQGMKNAEKNLSGGDPYECKSCKAILNKFSLIIPAAQVPKQLQLPPLKEHQSLWKCQFCMHPNVLAIDKEQIPSKTDIVYMMESEHVQKVTDNDSTLVFCIDVSGSMNSTSEVEGKVDLKFGLSQEEIEMLKQFMEPGDEAQFNFLPGHHNKNKTFISRKQCILSAIESQLQQLIKTDPSKRVGFVTFNNEVTVLGDSKTPTVNILGDKLYNKEAIIHSLQEFKLNQPLIDAQASLLNNLNKTEAKGQTALGPALVSAIEVASKGSPGSSIILCTDGLANIGIGQLEPLDQQKKKFYLELAQVAKSRNISVSIMTIKGEGCKMEVIGKLAELTNGSMKVVNPEKLSQDFANVLQDQVVGLNVVARIMLHRAMKFRNQQAQNLKENDRLLEKVFANATKNTRISFEYELRGKEELQLNKIDIEQLKRIPFQAQIIYTSPKGGKFLRVITAQSLATTEKELIKKEANLGVVHQRVTAQTAALYSKGNYKESTKFNKDWANYLSKNFNEKKYEKEQTKFAQKNERLNKAIRHKHRKSIEKKQELNESISEEEAEIVMNRSLCDSDEDQMELMDNLRERQNYSVEKKAGSLYSGEEKMEEESEIKEEIKKERKRSVERKKSVERKRSVERKKSVERKRSIGRRRSIEKCEQQFSENSKKNPALRSLKPKFSDQSDD